MGLNVELKMLIDGHTHAGRTLEVGDVIATNPERAERMIAQGFCTKVGVRAKKKSEAASKRPDGAEDSVDEVIEVDDVDDEETDQG